MTTLVIVGCGAKKLGEKTFAAVMYRGPLFTSSMRWARRIPDARRMIVSAKYGLLDELDVIEPYDVKMGDEGSVTVEKLRSQAEAKGVLDVDDVIVLAGRKYLDVLRKIWPTARCPIPSSFGIGKRLAWLKRN